MEVGGGGRSDGDFDAEGDVEVDVQAGAVHPVGSEPADRPWCRPVGGRAVAQLSVVVLAPADDGPVAAERATVREPRRQARGVDEIHDVGGCEPTRLADTICA
jgi:hypothetical protein